MSKKMRYTLLSHGFIEHDFAYMVSTPHPGNVNDKHPPAEWARFPCFSVLIQHEDLGWILYDTGWNPADNEGRLPQSFLESFPLIATKEDYLENRLAGVGLTKDDIDLLIISHSHWDHMGGIELFCNTRAGQKVIAPGPDYRHGITLCHSTPNPIGGGGYFKWNYDYEGINFDFVEEEDGDVKLCDEIELVTLTGHTPMVLALMLHMDSGTVIFPSDAFANSKNFGPPATPSGFMWDTVGFHKSARKLAKVIEKNNAKICFSHDLAQFETFKLAPEFYG